MPILDAAFAITPVPAHVPFAGAAGRAGHRVRPAHGADNESAALETRLHGRLFDMPERFMAQDKSLLAGRWGTIPTRHDLAVGSTDAEQRGTDQHSAVGW